MAGVWDLNGRDPGPCSGIWIVADWDLDPGSTISLMLQEQHHVAAREADAAHNATRQELRSAQVICTHLAEYRS